METGIISPNKDFQTPNPNCAAITDGRVKIVTEPLPLVSDYIPVNAFGFGGSIVQGIFKRNPNVYTSIPEDEDLPRLVLCAATTETGVLRLFDYIEKHPALRAEFFALLNKLSFPPTLLKPFRGYALHQNNQPIVHIKVIMNKYRTGYSNNSD